MSRTRPPNAHATISGNSSLQNASPCDPTRSVIDDVRTCVAQRDGPAGRVLEKERLQRAGDQVRARKRSSASRQVVGNPRPATRRRPHRRYRDGEAPWRARALHSPRHQAPPCARRAARLRNVTGPIGGRLRRRTSRAPRIVLRQTPASTRGAAASRRPAGGCRQSWSAVRRRPQERHPTARSTGRHRANTTASGGSDGTYAVTCLPPS